MVDQRGLAAAVALVLPVQLRDRHVRLVDDGEVVTGEEIEERVGRLARAAAVDRARVVLDAVAEAHLPHVLEVVLRAHAEPLGLEELALLLEPREALLQFVLDAADGGVHAFVGGGVVGGGEQDELVELLDAVAGERVEHPDRLDVVAEHLDADRGLVVGGMDLEDVTLHPELATDERHLVPLVLHGHQAAEHLALVVGLADAQHEHLVGVLDR